MMILQPSLFTAGSPPSPGDDFLLIDTLDELADPEFLLQEDDDKIIIED